MALLNGAMGDGSVLMQQVGGGVGGAQSALYNNIVPLGEKLAAAASLQDVLLLQSFIETREFFADVRFEFY